MLKIEGEKKALERGREFQDERKKKIPSKGETNAIKIPILKSRTRLRASRIPSPNFW